MRELVERFALYLLRKAGRSPVEVAIGNKVLFFGRWWTVLKFNTRYDSFLDRAEVEFTAVRYGEEDVK